MKIKVTSFLLAITALLLGGCAATGPKFSAEATPTNEQALVYIYRPSAFQGGAISYDVHVGPKEDDKALVTLKNGGYFPYYVQPGELELWSKTETEAAVTLDLSAGEVKYVRGGIAVGFLAGRPELEVVDPEVGAKEILKTKRLEAAN